MGRIIIIGMRRAKKKVSVHFQNSIIIFIVIIFWRSFLLFLKENCCCLRTVLIASPYVPRWKPPCRSNGSWLCAEELLPMFTGRFVRCGCYYSSFSLSFSLSVHYIRWHVGGWLNLKTDSPRICCCCRPLKGVKLSNFVSRSVCWVSEK